MYVASRPKEKSVRSYPMRMRVIAGMRGVGRTFFRLHFILARCTGIHCKPRRSWDTKHSHLNFIKLWFLQRIALRNWRIAFTSLGKSNKQFGKSLEILAGRQHAYGVRRSSRNRVVTKCTRIAKECAT